MPFIEGYTKKDGTEVSAHSRSAPGSGRQLTTAGIVVLLVWGIGGGHIKIEPEKGHTPAGRLPASAPAVPGEGAGR